MVSFDKEEFLKWVKTYAGYDQLVTECKAAFEGWSVRDPQNVTTHLKAFIDVAEKVVELVEKFSKDAAQLDDKTKLDAAVEFIDDCIKLPFFLEWADDIVIRHILSTVVIEYNKVYGHNWLEAKNGTK